MVPALNEYLKTTFLFERQHSLYQWQEKSCIFVFAAVCIAALPALINSSISAVRDELWGNLIAYNLAYIICVIVIVFRSIPFKVRAWTGILVFFGLGFLSLFTIGPAGSGRIWLFSTTIFTTLILGIHSGALILAGQAAVLAVFYYLLYTDFIFWKNPETHPLHIWVTTSTTLMFLSIVSMVAVGRLVRGISYSLDESRKTQSQLQETTRQLSQRVKEHNRTIVSLRESERRWHFALEGAGDGVWDWDLISDQLFLSAQWKKMLGFGRDEIGSGTDEWFNRIHPDDRERVVHTLRQNIETRVPDFKNRYRLICRDGTPKWILDRGRVMAWAQDGSPARIIGTHADITMIKEFEDQQAEYETRLQQAQKMEAIGTLAGGIAHDFNNILFPILGHSEMLLDELEQGDGSSRKSLEQIHSSALRAKELVQQILTFSRQETIEYRSVKVQVILKEVIKLLRSTLPRNIEIKSSVDTDCPAIFADAIQIHQILMNLATNANHAMRKGGGELRIYLNKCIIDSADSSHLGIRSGPAVCLAVADTGTGMMPELVHKIFDPFFTTKEKGEGTGMGLSVVHGIVKNYKGSINVYSEPGMGTEFKIYFPAEEQTDPHTQIKDQADLPFSPGSEHILLVDDEDTILDMEEQTLKRLGYSVTARNNPQKALTAFLKTPYNFDLVITDLSMPGMSGKELTSRLLQIRPDIPVILCTGFSETLRREVIRKLGIKEVIMKPVLLKKLSSAVRKILDGCEPSPG